MTISKTPKRRGTKKQLEIDDKILKLIQQTGGRASYRTIAKMLDLPPSTVYDHLDFLISKRILKPNWDMPSSKSELDLTNSDFMPLKKILNPSGDLS